MEPPKHLFDSDDDEHDPDDDQRSIKQRRSVTINRKFAREYQARKEEEELKQSRRRDDEESDTDESSTDEDEAADLLTTELDVEILRTIHAVRSKDARIYDPQTRFFPTHSNDDDDSDANEHAVSVRTKPKRYKDVVREQILEQMDREEENGEVDDGDDEREDARRNVATTSHSHRLAYDSTQVGLRQAFLESAAQFENLDEEDDVMLVKKTKATRKNDADSQRQLEAEIERLRQTTTGEDNNNELVDHKGEVADGQTFLLDYFKNRPWLERDESDDTDGDDDDVNENVAMKGSISAVAALKTRKIDSDEASLEELDQADDFEAAFNFRFEQATEGSGISSATGTLSGFEHSNISYARGNNSNQALDPSLAMPTLRRPDDSRKLQRQARKERKATERKAKEEQLKRLKNAKRHEMNTKLRQIQAVMGQTEQSADAGGTMDEAAIMKLLEGDFDPEQFESLMAATYNDDFYQQSDPEWINDMAVRESLLKHKVAANEDGNGDDEADVLVGPDHVDGGLYDNHEDAVDYEHDNYDQEEDWEQEEEWPADNEEEAYNDDDENDTEITKKVKAKINEELYKLDYEDIVAGIPTRFKYRQVTPNNYGLSTSEILCARDSTLKQFVSLKKLAPYAEQEHHVGSRQRRRFRERLKQELEEENEKEKQEVTSADNETGVDGDDAVEPGDEKKKRRRRLKKGRLQKDEKNETAKIVTSIAAAEGDPLVTPKDTDETTSLHSILPLSVKTVSSETDKEERTAKRKRSKKKESNDSTVNGVTTKQSDSKALKRAKKSKKPKMMEGVSVSRLASYGF